MNFSEKFEVKHLLSGQAFINFSKNHLKSKVRIKKELLPSKGKWEWQDWWVWLVLSWVCIFKRDWKKLREGHFHCLVDGRVNQTFCGEFPPNYPKWIALLLVKHILLEFLNSIFKYFVIALSYLYCLWIPFDQYKLHRLSVIFHPFIYFAMFWLLWSIT